MATFKNKTKNEVNIGKKPRVYFTCHPDDFEKYFKMVCDDIFKTHDCAIYYTENMREIISEDEKEVMLGRNNLFVVPITFNLLSTSNRAMDEDVPYALKAHIPVLPIMMEPGIDNFYSQPDKFGELQYLNHFSTDLTEISYADKLKKYLESVLISDEIGKRVRAAFDAYIFLSYRKKDRKYANELMRLIHSNPECRDIAIWFDEFLTPGESFKENIERILDDCKLFTLLITPHLLEKVLDKNGKKHDNYVISTELPLARKKKAINGTDIFAVEMQTTDKDKLHEINIEEYVNSRDKEFRTRLLEAVSKMAITRDNTPEHNFLIGIAYLDGIDVEVNTKLAIRLIEIAADSGLKEAMKKIVSIYYNGIGIEKDINTAITYQKKIAEHLRQKASISQSDLLDYLEEELYLAKLETEANLLKNGRNTCLRVIKLCKSNGGYGPFFSEDRIEYYIRAYMQLGEIFSNREDLIQSKECYEKAQTNLNKLHNDNITKRNCFLCGCLHYQLGEIYSKKPFYDYRYTTSNYIKAINFFQQSTNTDTIHQVQIYIDKCNLRIATEYERNLSQRSNAIEIYSNLTKRYELIDFCFSPDEFFITVHAFYRLGVLYQNCNDLQKAAKAYNQVINLFNKTNIYYEDNYKLLRLFLLASVKQKKLLNINIMLEYKPLLILAKTLYQKIPSRFSKELLAELYMEFWEIDKSYPQKAYKIYEKLCYEHPEFYTEDLSRLRKFLWNNNLTNDSFFTKITMPVISQKNGSVLYCKNPLTKQTHKFALHFISCNPLDEIEQISITYYKYITLKGLKMSNVQIEPPTYLLQICPKETNENEKNEALIPDEYITITYKNKNTKEYVFCYG